MMRQRTFRVFAVTSMTTIAAIGLLGTAHAQPSGPTWCSAEAQLVPSAADVGAVYVQSGALCMEVSSLEARIETQAFRDGVLVDSASQSCPRGHFAGTSRCEVRRLSVSNPAGSQDFEVRVTVRLTPDQSADFDRTARTNARGSY